VSQFPAFIAHGNPQAEGRVGQYTFLSTDTSQPGDLVFLDTADNNVKKCGANPALILGICLGYAPTAPQVALGMKPQPYPANQMLVEILTGDVTVGLSSLVTPAVAYLLRSQDIANVTISTGAGIRSFWQLLSTTGNTRVRVIDIDVTNGIFYVRFIDTNLQALVS
jgi:hypothetical protein